MIYIFIDLNDINATWHCMIYCHFSQCEKSDPKKAKWNEVFFWFWSGMMTWTCPWQVCCDSPSVMIIRIEEVCIVTLLYIFACNNALITGTISAHIEIRMTQLLEFKWKHRLLCNASLPVCWKPARNRSSAVAKVKYSEKMESFAEPLRSRETVLCMVDTWEEGKAIIARRCFLFQYIQRFIKSTH